MRCDLGVEHVARQPVARDAEAHHAAGHRAGLADRDRVPATREVVGGGQAGRAGADDEHALAGRLGVRGQAPALADRLVAEEALDAVDADGLVELRAVAGGLARVVADASHHGGQRVVLDELAPRRLVVAGLGVVEPVLDVLAGRAGVVARRQPVHVHGPLLAPGAGLVGEARADVQRDRERLVHHAPPSPFASARAGRAARMGSPPPSPSSPKRRMLRSAPAWMRAITSARGSGSNRCAKRLCGRR